MSPATTLLPLAPSPSLRPSGPSPPHRLQLLLTLKARQHALDQLAAFEPLLILQLLRACQEPDLSAALFARHALAGLVHLGSPAPALLLGHPMPSRSSGLRSPSGPLSPDHPTAAARTPLLLRRFDDGGG